MSGTVKKALALLDLVGRGHRNLVELSEASGMPKSTVHRLVRTLVDCGYLSTDRHELRIGYKVLELGQSPHGMHHVAAVARPHMEALAEKTCETIHLGALDGADIVYLDKVDGTRGLQMVSRIGVRTTAQVTALGKVLIAHLAEADWPSYVALKIQPRTPHTVVDRADVYAMLRDARAVGYAYDDQENELGIRCVASPVWGPAGRVVAAISLSGATVYISDDRRQSLAHDVAECARRIAVSLGGGRFVDGARSAIHPEQP